jgi:hypothetical protein
MDTAKKLEEIVEQLRQGDWNLRAPQELADLLAETITALSTPAAADAPWPMEQQPDGSMHAVDPADLKASAPEPVALTERFDRQAVTNLIASERVELLEAKYTGKGFDAERLAELDTALMALWPRVTPEMRAALAASQPAPVEADALLKGLANAVQELKEDGFWRSCSGCHELNEGHDTGPRSAALGCALGSGCGECGGIGAVWDTTDYASMSAPVEAKAVPEDPMHLDWAVGQAIHNFFAEVDNGDGTIAFDHCDSDDIDALAKAVLTTLAAAPTPSKGEADHD